MNPGAARNEALKAWIRGQKRHQSEATVLVGAHLGKNYLNQGLARVPDPAKLRRIAEAAAGDYLDLCIHIGLISLDDLRESGCTRLVAPLRGLRGLAEGSPEKLDAYLRRRLDEVGTSAAGAAKALELSRGGISSSRKKGLHPDLLRRLAPVCRVSYLALMLIAGHLQESDLARLRWRCPAELRAIPELDPSRVRAAGSTSKTAGRSDTATQPPAQGQRPRWQSGFHAATVGVGQLSLFDAPV